jgi:hypothetical protein
MQQKRIKKRYSPEEAVIVIERLLDEENDGWAFCTRTNEHILFRCPGCGQESYRVYLDSGRASCSNPECEEIPTKSEPLFSAVARLCGYDKQEHKEEVWGRIERELEAHEKEECERELEERRQPPTLPSAIMLSVTVGRGVLRSSHIRLSAKFVLRAATKSHCSPHPAHGPLCL